MTAETDFQKRILALLAGGGRDEWQLAGRLFADFERNVTKRGAYISSVSRALSSLIEKRLVAQGAFCSRGRYATYYRTDLL